MLRDQFGDLFFRIVQISKNSGPYGADLYTRRLQTRINPVMAKITLLDDRHKGVEVSGIIWASGDTISAADTSMFIDDDDSILLPPGCLNRTIDDTGRGIALIAERREKVSGDVWVPTLFDDLHP